MEVKAFGTRELVPVTLESLEAALGLAQAPPGLPPDAGLATGLPELDDALGGRLVRGGVLAVENASLQAHRALALALLLRLQERGARVAVLDFPGSGLWRVLVERPEVDHDAVALVQVEDTWRLGRVTELLLRGDAFDLLLVMQGVGEPELPGVREAARDGRAAVVLLDAERPAPKMRGGWRGPSGGIDYDLLRAEVEQVSRQMHSTVFRKGGLTLGHREDDRFSVRRSRGASPYRPAPPPPRPVPVPRFLNTWFEGDREPVLPLVAGVSYRFAFRISFRKTERVAGRATPFTEPDFGHHTEVPLLATIYGGDFDVGRRHHAFVLPRDADSEEVSTGVTPLRPGRASLRLVLSLANELEILQSVRIEVDVVEMAESATAREAS
jgi:hypothetical protein